VNTNVVAVVFVSALLCGIVGVSASPQAATTETTVQTSDESLGDDVSVFMQRGVAAANGSVDSGMWLAAFERAENQSRKQALVSQRAETLGARLDHLETRVRRFSPTETNRSVAHRARWARLAADRDALSTSISEAKTAAASEGVNATGLDRLSRRIETLTIPNAASNDTRKNGVNASPSTRRPHTADGVHTDGLQTGGTTYAGP
jgi:ABC-type Na+ efflux pump permease subunit